MNEEWTPGQVICVVVIAALFVLALVQAGRGKR